MPRTSHSAGCQTEADRLQAVSEKVGIRVRSMLHSTRNQREQQELLPPCWNNDVRSESVVAAPSN